VNTVRAACRPTISSTIGNTRPIHGVCQGVASANSRCMSMHRWIERPVSGPNGSPGPATDGRELVLTRYTEPEPELRLLLNKLKLELPAQPPPRSPLGPCRRSRCSADLRGSA